MLRIFKNLSLVWKMTVVSSVPLVLAAIAVISYFPANERDVLESGLEAKMRTVANMLSFSLAPAVQLQQLAGMEELFAGAKQDKELLAIRVEDLSNNRLTGLGDKDIDTRLRPEYEDQILSYDGDVLNFAYQIKNEGQPVGLLRLAYSLEGHNTQVRNIWTLALLLSLAIYLIGILVSALMARFVAAPLIKMKENFEGMARGDLNQRVLVDRSTDEIGSLATAFNQLLHQLQELNTHARYISEGDLTHELDGEGDLVMAFHSMTGALQELGIRFNEMAHSIDGRTSDILATAREQEAGSAQQAATVSELTATTGELAATARQIADNAESVSSAAEAANQTVTEGRRALSSFVESINAIQTGNEIINDNIMRLNRQVQQIGGIIDIIDGVADRSDLLALNAALEGTKAGEAGKGFLLVAAEMRRLAENTFNSTAEVKQLITEVTEGSNATVMATESGMKATLQGVLRAQETEESFERIEQTIRGTAQAAKQISVATQQQHTGTDQIVSVLGETEEVSKQALEGIRQTTHAVGELSQTSTEMRDLVSKYRFSADQG